MQRLVIDMQNYLMCDVIKMALHDSGDFSITIVEDPKDVPRKCFIAAATVLLMEVTGNGIWGLANRLKTADAVRRQVPGCKVVVMVDEHAESPLARQVKQAKLDGRIDQFIYKSTSASYLAAILETV